MDLVTILYSLGVLCYGELCHATTEKLQNNNNMSEDTIITSEHINNEFLLVDGVFWLALFLLVFVLIELAASISMILNLMLCSCNFTLLLYLACTSSFCSVQLVKPLTPFMWEVHAILMLIVTNVSILDGSCLLFIDLTLAFSFYIKVVEKEMTVIKFLNV